MKFLAVIVCTTILCGVSPGTTAREDGAINPRASPGDVEEASVEALDNEGGKLEVSSDGDEELTESSNDEDEDLEASWKGDDGLELAEDDGDAELDTKEGMQESEKGLEEVEEVEEEEKKEQPLSSPPRSKVFFMWFVVRTVHICVSKGALRSDNSRISL